jgi:L,D-transpeptidase catalytic domain
MKMKKYGLTALISLLFFTSTIGQPREKGGTSNPYLSKSEFTGSENSGNYAVPARESGVEYFPFSRLMLYADVLKLYAKSNDYDTSFAFLINMGLRSSRKRFFIVNLKNMCIEKSGLVAHGRGDERFAYTPKFSNASGSNCTSLGKYRIGKSYKGFFGLAFKMHGLEESNNKAYERNVVMHGMHCIPEVENGKPICQSEGCPAVSDRFILEIKKVIDSSEKPVLLWIFDSNKSSAKRSSSVKELKKHKGDLEKKKNQSPKRQA